MSTEPLSHDILYTIATAPRPDAIHWQEEYARLYKDAEAKEAEQRAEIMRLEALAAIPPEQPLLDCAKRLSTLAQGTVDVDLSTVHRYSSHSPGTDEAEYSIYTRWDSVFYKAPTLAAAEAKFREAWGRMHQPVEPPAEATDEASMPKGRDPQAAAIRNSASFTITTHGGRNWKHSASGLSRRTAIHLTDTERNAQPAEQF